MAGKLKVKFLTVIWGKRYIEEFASVSLPSYLAPGNLPYLASATDLEIVILTSRDSQAKFDQESIFGNVRALCNVRFIFIDDLIAPGNYGVTLTLAYARGIMDSGTEQTSTYFVFMNSDFVLADGALRTLAAKLEEGHPCIMAPSLRACSETTFSQLRGAVDAESVLAMPPRQMVQLAFDNLHPTAVAKTVTQNLVTCATHNQIYWQIDDTALLARYHLIFMLAIKPEVPLPPVNSYCDYGFVPELVPSNRFLILNDSDDFFMLELQSMSQERSFIMCGSTPVPTIGKELSRWTTAEHRRFAQVDIVFHTQGLPAGLAKVKEAAKHFFSLLTKHMAVTPKPHEDHIYWVAGLQAWSSLKFPFDTPVLPPEAKDLPISGMPSSNRKMGLSLNRRYIMLLGFMRRRAGVIPRVPIWHRSWQDSQLILDWIDKMKSTPNQKTLFLSDENSYLNASLPYIIAVDRRSTLAELLVELEQDSGAQLPLTLEREVSVFFKRSYDNVFVHVRHKDLWKVRKIVEYLLHTVSANNVAVFIQDDREGATADLLSSELIENLDNVLTSKWMGYNLSVGFAGGAFKAQIRDLERKLLQNISISTLGPPSVFAAIAWPLVGGLMAAANFASGGRSEVCPKNCTSMLLSISKMQSRRFVSGDCEQSMLTPDAVLANPAVGNNGLTPARNAMTATKYDAVASDPLKDGDDRAGNRYDIHGQE